MKTLVKIFGLEQDKIPDLEKKIGSFKNGIASAWLPEDKMTHPGLGRDDVHVKVQEYISEQIASSFQVVSLQICRKEKISERLFVLDEKQSTWFDAEITKLDAQLKEKIDKEKSGVIIVGREL